MESDPLHAELAALARRVADLERRLADLEPPATPAEPGGPVPSTGSPVPATGGPIPGVAASPIAPAPSAANQVPLPPPPGATPAAPAGPAGPSGPIAAPAPSPSPVPAWATTEGLLKWAGVALVVLAAIFLVGTAISRGWIGPEVQLAGASLIGVGLLAWGQRLSTTRWSWAVAVACGGAVVLPACAAATVNLDLLDRYPALVVLGLVAVAVVAYALWLSMEAVATVVLVAAQLALLAIADDQLAVLAPGLFIVLSAVVATALDRWRTWIVCRLVVAALAALLFLTMLMAEGDQLGGAERVLAVAGVVILAAIGWFGPLLDGNRPAVGWTRAIDHRIVLGVPGWTWVALIPALDLSSDDAVGRTALAVGAVFGLATLGSFVAQWPTTLVAAQAIGAATVAAIGLTVLTQGPGLLVALTGLAVGSWVLARLLSDLLLTIYAAGLTVIVGLWTVVLIVLSLSERRPWAEIAATALVIALVTAAAVVADRARQAHLAEPLIVAAWVSALLWLAGIVVHGPQGQVAVSLLWAVAAVAGLVVGVMGGRRLFRILGLATLGVVLTKLLTVDLAEVDVLWRVGLFLVIGTGLLRLGYVLPRLAARADQRSEGPPPPDGPGTPDTPETPETPQFG